MSRTGIEPARGGAAHFEGYSGLVGSCGIRLDAQAVVDGASKLLLTPEVSFGRLNRHMSQEEEAWTAIRQLPLTDAEFGTIASNVTPYMK